MSWFSGRYDTDYDASEANTISDQKWKGIQDRAGKANPKRTELGSREMSDAARRGSENLRNRWWN